MLQSAQESPLSWVKQECDQTKFFPLSASQEFVIIVGGCI